MPRENMSGGGEPNPACRWFEWNGQEGNIFYYDKNAPSKTDPTKKGAKIQLPCDFTFIVLNRLGVVRGWDESSKSGIVSNEVADTRSQPMEVRSFKGGKIASGLWQEIKDRVKVRGGSFHASLYIAFKEGTELKIGNIQFRGGALGEWFEFERANAADIYTKAVRIVGVTEGKKGTVKFKLPKFEIMPIKPETDDAAGELQKEVNQYLEGYFKRTVVAQAEHVQNHPPIEQQEAPPSDNDFPPEGNPPPEPDGDVPF